MKTLRLCLSMVIIISCLSVALSCAQEEVQTSCPKLDEQAPQFSLNTLEGKPANLQDYLGKTVMLSFWQTTCTWCNYQMPFLQAIYDKYSSSGLVVLAVNVSEETGRVKPYITESGYTFPVLMDKDAEVNIMYCVPGFPATLFIDQTGFIRSAKLGAFQNEQEIEEYLKSLQ